MKAINELRKIAKPHGFKIKTETFSFGRSGCITDSDGSGIGNVFFKESELYKRLVAFKADIPEGLFERLKEEEGSLVARGIFDK
jgi:hypothetical protein